MVEKVRISRCRLPAGPGVRQHTTTVFLWTSSPAQWVYSTSKAHLPQCGGLAGYPGREIFLYVFLRRAEYHNAVCHRVSGSGCLYRLKAPELQRPCASPWDTLPYFHPAVCAERMSGCYEIRRSAWFCGG